MEYTGWGEQARKLQDRWTLREPLWTWHPGGPLEAVTHKLGPGRQRNSHVDIWGQSFLDRGAQTPGPEVVWPEQVKGEG